MPLPQGGGASLPSAPQTNGNNPGPGAPKRFDWEITWSSGAPDGNTRNLFKINGNFPGPTLEVTEGDNVEVRVVNQSPYNTTVHHHGKHQSRVLLAMQTDGADRQASR